MADQKKKKGKHFKASFYWLFTAAFSVLFAVFFYTASMFPKRWKYIAIGVIAVILLVTGIISFLMNRDHKNHYILKAVNIILAVIMAVLSVLLPYYETRIGNMIDNNNSTTNIIKMNVYAMSDSYKAAHTDIFTDQTPTATFASDTAELKSYADASFITQLKVDSEYQKEAIDKIEKLVGKEIAISDKDSIQEAAQALYNNEAPVMIMNSAYAEMLEDMDGFTDFDTDTRVIYTVEVQEESSNISLNNTDLTSKPFAVFIGGKDEEGELTMTGRTDVAMVVVVNPATYQLGIFSYPRDSYIPNPAANNGLDKLTHLGVYGLDNSMAGLENLLSVDIENYVVLNFTTYLEIINALGGVDVDNPYTFQYDFGDMETFEEGTIHLEGMYALDYVRERHNLPDGDFGRTMHEQLVMEAILKKVTSPSMLIHFDSLITALNGTFLTNLTSSAIYSFMQYQLDNNISWNIVSYRAEGTTDYAICASAPSQELSVVLPYENQLEFMSKQAQAIWNGETVTQEDMPEGYGIKWEAVHGSSTSSYDSYDDYDNSYNNSYNNYYEQPTPEPQNNNTGNDNYQEQVPAETPVETPAQETVPQENTETESDNNSTESYESASDTQ